MGHTVGSKTQAAVVSGIGFVNFIIGVIGAALPMTTAMAGDKTFSTFLCARCSAAYGSGATFMDAATVDEGFVLGAPMAILFAGMLSLVCFVIGILMFRNREADLEALSSSQKMMMGPDPIRRKSDDSENLEAAGNL